MPAALPEVHFEAPPSDFVVDPSPERPKLAEGTEMVSFRVLRQSKGAGLVSGCVATPIPGWVEDMRPSVEGRTIALAGASTERMLGDVPIDARPSGKNDGIFVLRSAKDLDGPVIGTAKTFVGFDESSRVLTCFIACATKPTPSPAASPLGCEAAVAGSRLVGSANPPTPGIALRSVTWAVHNPRETALGGAAIVMSLAVLAIFVRRRPRFRMNP